MRPSATCLRVIVKSARVKFQSRKNWRRPAPKQPGGPDPAFAVGLVVRAADPQQKAHRRQPGVRRAGVDQDVLAAIDDQEGH
jgi:hypothetical protein